MSPTVRTLLSPSDAAGHLADPSWLFVDCRASLVDPEAPRRDYEAAHIPGARFADLESDLSGPASADTGRHPLPEAGRLSRFISELGINSTTTVVCYDDASGAMAAARLWWLLVWQGHGNAFVLDGGLRGWRAAGLPTDNASVPSAPGSFLASPNTNLVATTDDVKASGLRPDAGGARLIDVRTPERYAGFQEPIDPIAGHIPGAVSLPYAELLDDEGFMLPRQTLAQLLRERLPGLSVSPSIVYCGSGVTAAFGALAIAHATGELPRLYAGSWSEWIRDNTRPVATGLGT